MKKLFTPFWILSVFLFVLILCECKSSGEREQHARAVALADSIRIADSLKWALALDSIEKK